MNKPAKVKVSVANPTAKATNNRGIRYPRWHQKNPRNAIVVPAALAPTHN